jgi:hypothetical protein
MMAKLNTFVCNVCAKQRASDSNHWRRVYLVERDGSNKPAGIFFVDWDVDMMIRPSWQPAPLPEKDAHVCGDACAVKAFSYWLTHGSLEGLGGPKKEGTDG